MTAPKAPRKPRYTDRNRIMDYRTVFGTPEGKRVLADMCARYWVFGSLLHADAIVMAHREGERNTVLDIMRYLEMKPADEGEIRQSIVEQFGLSEE